MPLDGPSPFFVDSAAVFRIGHQVGEVTTKVYDPENTGTVTAIGDLGYADALRRSAQTLETG